MGCAPAWLHSERQAVKRRGVLSRKTAATTWRSCASVVRQGWHGRGRAGWLGEALEAIGGLRWPVTASARCRLRLGEAMSRQGGETQRDGCSGRGIQQVCFCWNVHPSVRRRLILRSSLSALARAYPSGCSRAISPAQLQFLQQPGRSARFFAVRFGEVQTGGINQAGTCFQKTYPWTKSAATDKWVP